MLQVYIISYQGIGLNDLTLQNHDDDVHMLHQNAVFQEKAIYNVGCKRS
jgi:hypothetical protein